MTRTEAINLLRTDVPAWNRARDNGETIPDLVDADLGGADLRSANLSDADLGIANFSSANLSGASLSLANLLGAGLMDANLSGADLGGAGLTEATLRGADLSGADLNGADLTEAILSGANLSGANLCSAVLARTKLDSTKLDQAILAWTIFADVDLSAALDLPPRIRGPCTLGVDTLVASRGRIPTEFLSACGLLPWQVKMAELFNPVLDPVQISEIQNDMFNMRTEQFPWAGGIFISYAHHDGQPLVDKLYDRLKSVGFPVWLDRHELTAGPTQPQVDRAIRFNDVVLLVLSEASIKSDWVEHELKSARRKEREQGRNILCPVAVDDSWKGKVLGSRTASLTADVNWEHLGKKNVLDFSKWKTKAFKPVFEKLVRGLKNWYGTAVNELGG